MVWINGQTAPMFNKFEIRDEIAYHASAQLWLAVTSHNGLQTDESVNFYVICHISNVSKYNLCDLKRIRLGLIQAAY